MATVTLRSLVHGIPSVRSRSTYQKCPSLSPPFSRTFFLQKQKPLAVQISPVTARRFSVYASAPYAEPDTEIEKQQQEEVSEIVNASVGEAVGGVEVIRVEPVKKAPKRLRKDRARLYVGNIPFSATPNELAELFSEAGTVNSVDVVYDKMTDRSRGFAFVTMSTVDEAHEAVRMFDGSQLGGRTIKVNFPEVPRGAEREVLTTSTIPSRGYVDSPHKIYAGNLGWSLSSEALKEAFSSQSGMLGAKVIFDRLTGMSRGFGFVSFASAEDTAAALESMNGVEVEGRPLRLSFANKGSPSSSSSPEMLTENQENALETSTGTPGNRFGTIWQGVIADKNS